MELELGRTDAKKLSLVVDNQFRSAKSIEQEIQMKSSLISRTTIGSTIGFGVSGSILRSFRAFSG